MDFLIGGATAAIAVIGYLLMVGLYDWIDLRGARRIRRANLKRSQR